MFLYFKGKQAEVLLVIINYEVQTFPLRIHLLPEQLRISIQDQPGHFKSMPVD